MAINLKKEAIRAELEKANSKKGEPKPIKKGEAKSPKKGESNLDKKNLERHVEAVVSKREVKWIYPADINDTVSRKKFRQTSRDKIRKLERDIKANKDEKKTPQLEKELKALRKELLHNPADVV